AHVPADPHFACHYSGHGIQLASKELMKIHGRYRYGAVGVLLFGAYYVAVTVAIHVDGIVANIEADAIAKGGCAGSLFVHEWEEVGDIHGCYWIFRLAMWLMDRTR